MPSDPTHPPSPEAMKAARQAIGGYMNATGVKFSDITNPEDLARFVADRLDAHTRELRERAERAETCLAVAADKLNSALRDANKTEMLGDPLRSFAIRDGIDAYAGWATRIRAQLSAARDEATKAKLELEAFRDNLEAVLDAEGPDGQPHDLMDRVSYCATELVRAKLAGQALANAVLFALEDPAPVEVVDALREWEEAT